MQQGYLGLSDRCQDIDRVLAVGERLLLSEPILFQQILPGLLITNTTTLPERPALEIADWHICVDASDRIGIFRRPSVGKESATADGLKGHFLGQPFLLCHECIKGIPVFKGTRATQHVVRIDIRHVKTPLEQEDVDFRVILGKTCTPNPRLSIQLFFRQHDKTRFAIHLESHLLKSIPV